MGNCTGKKSKDRGEKPLPVKSYEEHSTSKHHLRLGVQFEKSPEGEVHVGFKGGLENRRDVVVKVDGEEEINKIPKVLDIVNDEQCHI